MTLFVLKNRQTEWGAGFVTMSNDWWKWFVPFLQHVVPGLRL